MFLEVSLVLFVHVLGVGLIFPGSLHGWELWVMPHVLEDFLKVVQLGEAPQVGLRVEFLSHSLHKTWAPLRQRGDSRQLPGLCCHRAGAGKEYWDGTEKGWSINVLLCW